MATSFSISAGTNRVRITKISEDGRERRHIEPRCSGSISIEAGDVLRIRELPNTGTERGRPHQVEALPNSTTGGQGFTENPPPMPNGNYRRRARPLEPHVAACGTCAGAGEVQFSEAQRGGVPSKWGPCPDCAAAPVNGESVASA